MQQGSLRIQAGQIAADDNRYVRKSEEEIERIARGCVDGSVYASWQIPEPQLDDTMLVFMPLMLMSADQQKEMDRDGICHFYAEMAHALPRVVNGLPMFFKVEMLDHEDSRRIIARVTGCA